MEFDNTSLIMQPAEIYRVTEPVNHRGCITVIRSILSTYKPSNPCDSVCEGKCWPELILSDLRYILFRGI